jgi:Predicted metal-dependent hydrolase
MKTSKAKQISAGGVAFTLIKSDRKTVGLQVKADGEVIVHAPFALSESEIKTMVASKAAWIECSRQKIAARKPEMPSFSCADGEELPYLGSIYKIVHREDTREPHTDGGALVLPSGMGTDGLVLWLKCRAAEELNLRLSKYAPMIGVQYKSVRLSDARTRWGMCSGKDSINLSWRLIFCLPEAIDFVVAHELCHVKHKNHGAKFKAELERALPGSAKIDKWLRANSNLIALL